MDRNDSFLYINDMINSFFNPGLWPLFCDYVALRDTPKRWNFPSLKAPYWRVYWHNNKNAALRLGQRVLPIRPDHLYIIPPNTNIGSIHRDHCRQLFIHFQVRHPYALRGPAVITLPLTRQRQYFVRNIIACCQDKENARQRTALMVHAFLDTLIADLLDQALSFRKIDTRLLNVLNYMEQHLEQPIDNKKLAILMHAHPQTMRRLFKAELAKSPQAYLRQLRVDRACWLLRASEDPIKTIAGKTGFCDPYHFTKVFSKIIGQSPSRFRAHIALA